MSERPLLGSAWQTANGEDEAQSGPTETVEPLPVRPPSLGQFEGISQVDSEIPNCVLDLGVAQQNLDHCRLPVAF
ncbi:hypothetical protein MPL3356_110121 [Mesorhizobium plurifarium]|uniref:Uncharacterized protein n=1 Tax=Mesorhizobium plurifarium TaxID=69974 RepID=A0A090DE74_MESPL|nr:hypothetical protein MPL3356_110121 [Mesorhizobium plurifarium]